MRRSSERKHQEIKESIRKFLDDNDLPHSISKDKGWNYIANQLEWILKEDKPAKGTPFSSAKHRALACLAKLHNNLHPDKPLYKCVQKRFQIPKQNKDKATRFYLSAPWLNMRYYILKKYGRKCMACGTTNGTIVVDHIKPLRQFWNLRLDESNLQVLCQDCNRGKGCKDQTDWRPGQEYELSRVTRPK